MVAIVAVTMISHTREEAEGTMMTAIREEAEALLPLEAGTKEGHPHHEVRGALLLHGFGVVVCQAETTLLCCMLHISLIPVGSPLRVFLNKQMLC